MIKVTKRVNVSCFALVAFVFALLSDFSIYTLLFLTSILVHEMSHIAFLALFKVPFLRVSVFPFGIDILCDMTHIGYVKELVCVLAGSSANLTAGTICAVYFHFYDAKWALFFAVCNFALGVANLIPLSFFDGGRALGVVLEMLVLPDRAYIIQRVMDVICFGVFCLVCLGVLQFCDFNFSVIFSALYAFLSSVVLGIYKKRDI